MMLLYLPESHIIRWRFGNAKRGAHNNPSDNDDQRITNPARRLKPPGFSIPKGTAGKGAGRFPLSKVPSPFKDFIRSVL